MSPPLQIAVYISGHGLGHLMRTLNLVSLLSDTGKYVFHIRTTSPMQEGYLRYALHPTVVQTNPYQLDATQSLDSLVSFDITKAQTEETRFLQEANIQAVLSDAPSIACLLAHSLAIPSILVTNFTFDSIFQALLDNAPTYPQRKEAQAKIDEMTKHYALAHSVTRLPGYIHFLFSGPQIIDVPVHSRKAKLSRSNTLAGLGLSHLDDKKILLHSFGGHNVDALSELPKLPAGWTCLSQTIDSPPLFNRIGHDVYMPDLIGACDAVLGKMGWGTCSEVIANGYKPFIYVPRSAFLEEVGLLSWMQSAHRKIVRLEIEDYENTNWFGAIEEAQKMGEESSISENFAKNDADLIRIMGDAIERATYRS